MNPLSTRANLLRVSLLLTAASVLTAADQPTLRATLQPPPLRRPAPEFRLLDSSGQAVTLRSLRGRIVLLDFWATWCHGCRTEIPWFAAFERKYSAFGLTVVGVSLDDGGWKVIHPFLGHANIPYPILLGDPATSAKYHIEAMPDTFLLDRRGRIAASYTGLVDRENVDGNLRALLSEH